MWPRWRITLAFPERHCRFICGIGGTKRDNQLIDADHISRNLARKFNGFSETLYARPMWKPRSCARLLCKTA